MQRIRMYIQIVFVFIICMLCGSISLPVYADGINLKDHTELIDLMTDGPVTGVAYSTQYAFVGGSFQRAQLQKTRSEINQSNFLIIERYRHTFPLTQIHVDGPVLSMYSHGDELYIFGDFTHIDAKKRTHAAVISMSTLSLLPYVMDIDGHVLTHTVSEDLLLLGGDFKKINGANRPYFAAYQMSTHTFSDVSFIPDGAIRNIQANDQFAVITGDFSHVNGQSRNHVAVIDLLSRELTSYAQPLPGTVVSISSQNGDFVITTQNPDKQIMIQPSQFGAGIALTSGSGTSGSTVPSIGIGGSGTYIGIGQTVDPLSGELMVDSSGLGFQIPTLSTILTFAIRAFFAVAGLTALFYMLLGAFSWITSGGDKDAISAAREKIQSAVIGLIMILVVFAIVWTIEQVVFKRRICLGLTCSITLPSILDTTSQ